jgi:carbamoyl-phosphate synthase large subunit
MNFRLPVPGEGLLFGGDVETPDLAKIVDFLQPLGFKLYAANDTVKQHLESASKAQGVSVEVIEFPKQDKRLLREVFERNNIRGVFNLAKRRASSMVDEDYVMRRNAVDFGVPLFMEPRVSTFSYARLSFT